MDTKLPEWFEKGELPTPRTSCEVLFNGSWIETFIIGSHGDMVVFDVEGYNGDISYSHSNSPRDFRPLGYGQQQQLKRIFELIPEDKQSNVDDILLYLVDIGWLRQPDIIIS